MVPNAIAVPAFLKFVMGRKSYLFYAYVLTVAVEDVEKVGRFTPKI